MTPHTEPESLPELTDEEWGALLKADRGEQLTPDERDTVRGGAGRPRLVVHTWAGGLRPDYQSITHEGRAHLDRLDRIAGELTESMRDELSHGHAWGSTRVALERRGLVAGRVPTPLGRAVLKRAKAAQR